MTNFVHLGATSRDQAKQLLAIYESLVGPVKPAPRFRTPPRHPRLRQTFH